MSVSTHCLALLARRGSTATGNDRLRRARAVVRAALEAEAARGNNRFTWRRLAREGRLVEADETTVFAPAIIRGESLAGSQTSVPEHVVPAENVPSPSCLTTASGRIEIVLMHGPRVIVGTGVDAAALRRVLDVLERP